MARTHTSEVMQANVPFGSAPARGRLDHATLLGLFFGFGLLFAAMAVGGTPGAFLNLPALLIVIGGTFGVTTVCFSLRDIACTPVEEIRHVLQRAIDEMIQRHMKSAGVWQCCSTPCCHRRDRSNSLVKRSLEGS